MCDTRFKCWLGNCTIGMSNPCSTRSLTRSRAHPSALASESGVGDTLANRSTIGWLPLCIAWSSATVHCMCIIRRRALTIPSPQSFKQLMPARDGGRITFGGAFASLWRQPPRWGGGARGTHNPWNMSNRLGPKILEPKWLRIKSHDTGICWACPPPPSPLSPTPLFPIRHVSLPPQNLLYMPSCGPSVWDDLRRQACGRAVGNVTPDRFNVETVFNDIS